MLSVIYINLEFSVPIIIIYTIYYLSINNSLIHNERCIVK